MFVAGYKASTQESGRCFIVISSGQILCPDATEWMPVAESYWHFTNPQLNASSYCIGQYRQQDCYVVELQGQPELHGHHWADLRRLLVVLSESQYEMAARALQILQWRKDHRFCGRCGGATISHEQEMAKHCEPCDLLFYPRLSPCVIMLITRGDECLLARNANFPGPFYSALAGFIEVGETIESSLRREVYEEVGLEVGRLSYFGSQSWPFPSQLMIGFYAEYAQGEINIDGEEIVEANWYRYDDLPLIPNQHTLAGQLINQFVRLQQS